MMFRLCLLAPSSLALLALCVTGCADSHGRGDRDGAVAADSAAPDAALTMADVGPRDAAIDPTCGPRAFDLVCFDHVSAGVPTTVGIVARQEGDCFCGQDLVCNARVVADHVLAIDTSLCPAIPVCRACGEEATGTCELPALEEGSWRVTVDGGDALDLQVAPAGVTPERADVCVRRASIDSCGAIFTPTRFEVGRACHPDRVAEGTRAEVHVFDACGGCVQRGPCEVTVLESTILVRASRMPNACDIACPPVCAFDEHVCVTPPLAAGSYSVRIDGLPTDEPTTIEVGAGSLGGETCVP